MNYNRNQGNKYGPHMRDGLIDMLEWMKVDFSKRGMDMGSMAMCEIGTLVGESAAIFSDYFRSVHTVDPWDLEFVSMCLQEKITEEGLNAEYEKQTTGKTNITRIRLPSLLASRKFEGNSLDFVYIDGWHRLIPVVTDILSWIHTVRPGGFIGGHDYSTENDSQVIHAVKSTLGEPDRVFQDFSWIKRV